MRHRSDQHDEVEDCGTTSSSTGIPDQANPVALEDNSATAVFRGLIAPGLRPNEPIFDAAAAAAPVPLKLGPFHA
jgi:hypothetical protein